MRKNVSGFVLFFYWSCFLYGGNDQWGKTETIWNFGIISSCDKGLDLDPIQFFKTGVFRRNIYSNIKKGDVVWVPPRYILEFYRRVLPKVPYPFILVVSDGDESFPTDCRLADQVEKFIAHEKIIHIFAQNCDYQGSSHKVSHLPIGLDFHTIAYKGINGGWGELGTPKQQESYLMDVLKEIQPTYLRKVRAFVDFQHTDSSHGSFNRYLQFGEDRTGIFRQLLSTGLIDYDVFMRRSSLWKVKGQYAFSVSPHGNGLDCHRTWEDLVLGCIVIVKTSSLDALYEGLPVVIVKDWSEVTQENMDLWLKQYGDAFTNFFYREKLTNRYWLYKILEKACQSEGREVEDFEVL